MSEENRRAGNALLEAAGPLSGEGLIIADEGFAYDRSVLQLQRNSPLRAITNRQDIANGLMQDQFEVVVSDFDFSGYADESLDYLLLRLPKSKILAKSLYCEAFRLLRRGGTLLIAGYNQEGVKRVIQQLGQQFGEVIASDLLGKGLRLAQIGKTERGCLSEEMEQAYDHYHDVVTLRDPDEPWSYQTKPGIYGFDKIDQGSRFLVEYLRNHKKSLSGEVLDLGCGYGYLSLHYASIVGSDSLQLVATDANVAATEACRDNLAQAGIEAEVILDDVASTLPDRSFKTIIANPPFHQGFTTSTALTEKFISAVARLLRSRGSAYFVLNRFIAVESLVTQYQLRFEEVATNGQFKILRLWR